MITLGVGKIQIGYIIFGFGNNLAYGIHIAVLVFLEKILRQSIIQPSVFVYPRHAGRRKKSYCTAKFVKEKYFSSRFLLRVVTTEIACRRYHKRKVFEVHGTYIGNVQQVFARPPYRIGMSHVIEHELPLFKQLHHTTFGIGISTPRRRLRLGVSIYIDFIHHKI